MVAQSLTSKTAGCPPAEAVAPVVKGTVERDEGVEMAEIPSGSNAKAIQGQAKVTGVKEKTIASEEEAMDNKKQVPGQAKGKAPQETRTKTQPPKQNEKATAKQDKPKAKPAQGKAKVKVPEMEEASYSDSYEYSARDHVWVRAAQEWIPVPSHFSNREKWVFGQGARCLFDLTLEKGEEVLKKRGKK